MNVSVFESLGELPANLAAELRYPQQQNFFLTLDWFECLYATVLTGQLIPRVYVVESTAGTPALVFFGATTGGRKLLGLTNYYAQEFGAVGLEAGDHNAALTALIAFIAAESPSWQSADFSYLRLDREPGEALIAEFRRHGFMVHTSFQYENWYLDIAGRSFDEYYAERSSRLKNTIARKEKKLHRESSVEIRVYTDNDAELEAGIEAYTSVYARSWKKPEPYAEFSPALIRLCAGLGVLRLGVLFVDSVAVAAQLWITTQRKSVIYKLSYDEAFKKMSVGSILSRDLFRLAIDDDRVTEIDYGVGSEPYKRDWMESMRTLERLEAFNTRSPAGLGAAVLQGAKNLVKLARSA